jgi:hypothetical protein
MTHYVAESVESLFDNTDTGSSNFAFFTEISSDIGIQIRKALNGWFFKELFPIAVSF